MNGVDSDLEYSKWVVYSDDLYQRMRELDISVDDMKEHLRKSFIDMPTDSGAERIETPLWRHRDVRNVHCKFMPDGYIFDVECIDDIRIRIMVSGSSPFYVTMNLYDSYYSPRLQYEPELALSTTNAEGEVIYNPNWEPGLVKSMKFHHHDDDILIEQIEERLSRLLDRWAELSENKLNEHPKYGHLITEWKSRPNRGEVFNYLYYSWDVDDMMDFAKANNLPIHNIEKESMDNANALIRIDEAYVDKLVSEGIPEDEEPGIAVELLPGHAVVVNGHHRIERNRKLGVYPYKVYFFTLEQQSKFLMQRSMVEMLVNHIKGTEKEKIKDAIGERKY